MTTVATKAPEDATSATSSGRRERSPRTVGLAAAALLVVLAVLSATVTLSAASGPAAPGESSVEVGFARDMGAHHLQAVEMANLAAGRTTDPDIARIAFDISATQTNQVGRMQGWLSLWGISVSGGSPMQWMADSDDSGRGAHSHMGHDMPMPDGGGSAVPRRAQMPGMASDSDLAQLRAATGRAFDVLFLQLMIRHHVGGTHMAAYAAEHASVAAVAELASSMVASQTLEVATLTDLLTARGGQLLPAA